MVGLSLRRALSPIEVINAIVRGWGVDRLPSEAIHDDDNDDDDDDDDDIDDDADAAAAADDEKKKKAPQKSYLYCLGAFISTFPKIFKAPQGWMLWRVLPMSAT